MVGIRFILFVMGLCLIHDLSFAARYWVAKTGSDSNPCSSTKSVVDEDPGVYKLTLSAGKACITQPGDILTIKAGTYSGTSAETLRGTYTGTAANPIIIEGDPATNLVGCAITSTCQTIIKPLNSAGSFNNKFIASHFILRRLKFDHSLVSGNSFPVHIDGPCTDVLVEDVETMAIIQSTSGGSSGMMVDEECSFVTVRRMNSHDNGEIHADGTVYDHGIYWQGDDGVIEDSWFHDNASIGIQCYESATTSDGRPDRCTVRNTIFEGNNINFVNEGNDAQIYNNVFRNPRSGTNVVIGYGGSARVKLYNNLFYSLSGGAIGLVVGEFNGGANSEVRNNIFFGHTSEVILRSSSTGTVVEYNACPAAKSCGTTGKLSISAITDILVSTTDYTLKQGSSAINAGTTSLAGRACNGTCDIGPNESFTFSVGSITASTAEVTLGMSLNTPVQPTSTGWSISCTPNPDACPTPVITGVSLKSGSSGVVQINFSGGDCAANQTWKVSYDGSTGVTTDSIGLLLKQELSTFSNQTITNSCTGGGGGTPPANPTIYYKMNDGAGTNVDDTTANNNDGTLTNTPTWVTGYMSTGVNIDQGSTQYIAVPYGNTVNPSSQSLTLAIWVYITPGTESTASVVPIATAVGTNQRFIVSGQSGTWRLGVQSTNTGTASDLSVISGWQRVCVNFNSGTDTATIYRNGVAATSGSGVRSYTSYTLSGNIQIGQLPGNTSGAAIYDEFKLWTSVESCLDDYNSYISASTIAGTFSQAAILFQKVYTTALGVAEAFGANNASQNVVDGGAVAIVFQVNCDNVSNCDPTAFSLRYSTDGSTFSNVVPDVATSDGVYFWGNTPDSGLNSGVAGSALTGVQSNTSGPTQLTSSATPNIDLAQNSSITLRYIIKFVPGISGQSRYFKLYHQTGTAFNGSYTPSSGAQVTIIPMASNSGS